MATMEILGKGGSVPRRPAETPIAFYPGNETTRTGYRAFYPATGWVVGSVGFSGGGAVGYRIWRKVRSYLSQQTPRFWPLSMKNLGEEFEKGGIPQSASVQTSLFENPSNINFGVTEWDGDWSKIDPNETEPFSRRLEHKSTQAIDSRKSRVDQWFLIFSSSIVD